MFTTGMKDSLKETYTTFKKVRLTRAVLDGVHAFTKIVV